MNVFRSGMIVGAMALALCSASAVGAPWPERIVRILVPSAPGSSIDLAARVFADRLSQGWQRPVVVDDRAGADGILAVQALMQARDGHTLLLAFPGVVTVVPLLHAHLPYDPITDLVPIASVANDFLAV